MNYLLCLSTYQTKNFLPNYQPAYYGPYHRSNYTYYHTHDNINLKDGNNGVLSTNYTFTFLSFF